MTMNDLARGSSLLALIAGCALPSAEPTPAERPGVDPALVAAAADAASKTPIYVTVVTHDERSEDLSTYAAYQRRRETLTTIAGIVRDYRAAWSFGPDVAFLDAERRFRDPFAPSLVDRLESQGVGIDPHAHELARYAGDLYDYADVSWLLDRMTTNDSLVASGFDATSATQVGSLLSGVRATLPAAGSYVFRPRVLAMAGVPDHDACKESTYYASGVWHPRGAGADFLVESGDDKSAVAIGTGVVAGTSLRDDTWVEGPYPNAVEYIKDLASAITAGEAPAGKLYTAVIFFPERLIDADPAKAEYLRAQLAGLAPLASFGRVVYQDFTTIEATWRRAYGAEPNIYRPTELTRFRDWRRVHCGL